MLVQNFRSKLLHLHGHEFQASFFETGNHLTHQTALESTGLQNDKCSFHIANFQNKFQDKFQAEAPSNGAVRISRR